MVWVSVLCVCCRWMLVLVLLSFISTWLVFICCVLLVMIVIMVFGICVEMVTWLLLM